MLTEHNIAFSRSTRIFSAGLLLGIAFLSGCASISEQNAVKLATSGKSASSSALSTIFATDSEYESAMEAEVFFHSYAGVGTPSELLDDWQQVKTELDARKAVFSRLTTVYAAFGDLASSTAPEEIMSAIDDFYTALYNYSALVTTARPLVPESTSVVVGNIASQLLTVRKGRLIRQSSVIIRQQLECLLLLLDNKLVQEEMTSFQENLRASRLNASRLLMKNDLLDPSPMLNDLAADSGFKAVSDARSIIMTSAPLKRGVDGVMAFRIQHYNAGLEQRGYTSTRQALRALIDEHKKLEKGEPVTIDELQQIVNELHSISNLLSGRNQ
ncbi:MAG: hypothetical protein ACP5R6_07525 [Chlorobaculum sp.]